MKKLLTGILASTMILSTAIMASAQENNNFTPETLQQQYTQSLSSQTWDGVMPTDYSPESLFDARGGKYLMGIDTLSGRVVIPPTVDGFPTTTLYAYIIRDSMLNSYGVPVELPPVDTLVIPDSVTTIMVEAINCRATTIYLGSGIKNIENWAFLVNEGLTVYYNGTEEDRAKISIGRGNDTLENATWIYTASPTFPDWATGFVDFVSPEIMPDISTSNFNDASNRGLIAQSFYNMSANGANVSASHSFTDIGDFGTAVAWCHENEIMSGTGETTFGTYGNVNREQFCLILKQMATVLEKDTASGDVASLSEFSDSWSISDWAKEGVAWATANNLMAGSNGALNPHGDVTRLEVAIMLSAFDNL